MLEDSATLTGLSCLLQHVKSLKAEKEVLSSNSSKKDSEAEPNDSLANTIALYVTKKLERSIAERPADIDLAADCWPLSNILFILPESLIQMDS